LCHVRDLFGARLQIDYGREPSAKRGDAQKKSAAGAALSENDLNESNRYDAAKEV
jgi:hypothetical protein